MLAGFDDGCALFVARCLLLLVICYWSFDIVVGCWLLVVCRLSFVVCGSFVSVRWLMCFVVCLLCLLRSLFVDCRVFVVLSCVIRLLLFVV